MFSIIELLKGREVRQFNPGESILTQGDKTGLLFFLIEGTVEVLKNDTRVATASQPGMVFGELSALLGGKHTATVRVVKPSTFYVVQDPKAFLTESPAACFYVCQLLAQRLDALTKYVADVKGQFADHDHIGMVDEVLETLMKRETRPRIRPSESTIRHGQTPG
jgi:CRP/FNR family transcriptional regulator, cyclic AMP receptor protein